ncbi:hypothetical protein PHLGIDRAFT_123417 [Phlebiopsis gigantea 11061_1 CR5-6]|uniref:Uncharacterized protein n=1 Tax=Phlebiopsis gigantea (strain 11061_1 CR5-6) TaxID=745531 RepID=A0A0C3RYP0_PHLG1|nr:hypothetical protein PHLGIDRAFT_123417 [Phlebiopsis gigantea 11061_1 CR5-6]
MPLRQLDTRASRLSVKRTTSFARLINKHRALAPVSPLPMTVWSRFESDADSKDDEDSVNGADDGPVEQLDEGIIEASVVMILRAATSSIETSSSYRRTCFSPNWTQDDSTSPRIPFPETPPYNLHLGWVLKAQYALAPPIRVHAADSASLWVLIHYAGAQVPARALDVPPPAPYMIGNQRGASVTGDIVRYRLGSQEVASGAAAAAAQDGHRRVFPSALILDDVTTGLDSFAVCQLLSLNQPWLDAYVLFSRILLLLCGSVVYSGSSRVVSAVPPQARPLPGGADEPAQVPDRHLQCLRAW